MSAPLVSGKRSPSKVGVGHQRDHSDQRTDGSASHNVAAQPIDVRGRLRSVQVTLNGDANFRSADEQKSCAPRNLELARSDQRLTAGWKVRADRTQHSLVGLENAVDFGGFVTPRLKTEPSFDLIVAATILAEMPESDLFDSLIGSV